MNTRDTVRLLLTAYEKSGASGVYEVVNFYFPEWGWEFCEPCDDTTPTFESVCAVCFTTRRDEFVPVDKGLDERCDDCSTLVPDGEGIYPDGDEGRRVCVSCAEEDN